MNVFQSHFLTQVHCRGLTLAAALLQTFPSRSVLAAEDATTDNGSDPPSTTTTDTGSDLSSTGNNPWAAGVPKERRDSALALFRKGNQQFLDSLFNTASQTYREALKQWDHPGIHYNLAIALNHLDNPLEAHKHLLAALKYGGAPLDQKRREDANLRLRNTARQIATLEVSCREPGTTVTIDGRQTMKAPSRRTEFVLAGKHVVSASRPGHLPREYALVLAPNESKKVEVRLFTEEQLSELQRPLPFWLPVLVSGTGAVAMGITGVILQNRSNVLVERYDHELAEKHPNGNYDSNARLDVTDRANFLRTWAAISYGIGAATMISGAVWTLWFNKPKLRRSYTPEERERQTVIAPIVSSNVLGAMITDRF